MDIGVIPVGIIAVIVTIAAIGALFVIVTRGTRAVFGSRRRFEAGLGLEVLDARLKRGEISYAEYEIARKALGQ